MNEASRRFSRLDKDAKLELLIKAQRDLDTIHRTKWYGDDEGLTQYYKEKFGFYYAQLSETLTLACDEGIVTEWITPSALASPYYLFNYDAAQKFEEELIRKRKIRDQNDGTNV